MEIEWRYFLSKKGIEQTQKNLGLKPKSLDDHPIKKEIILKPSITEEKDEEEHKN